jgi:hypothetical protein
VELNSVNSNFKNTGMEFIDFPKKYIQDLIQELEKYRGSQVFILKKPD